MRTECGSRDTYSGDISALSLHRDLVELRPTDKTSDKEPDYRIVQECDGVIMEFGAVWKRSSGKGPDFLSILLDDPACRARSTRRCFSRIAMIGRRSSGSDRPRKRRP
jgi:uncharacterized protein (DUF736 family)